MSSEDYCIRSEDCSVVAGVLNLITNKKKEVLKDISLKIGVPYEELLLRYCSESVSFESSYSDEPSAF